MNGYQELNSSGAQNESETHLPTPAFDSDLEPFRAFVQCLELYVVPVVCIVGILGNGLSLAVFSTRIMRLMSARVYLTTLAVSDSVFLTCVLLNWLVNTGLDAVHRPVTCQLQVYLSYVSGFLSVWVVVAFTVERCLALMFPLKRQVSI